MLRHLSTYFSCTQRKLKEKEFFKMAKEKGGDAFGRKDYLDAVYWYSQAIQADPGDEKVLSNRSLCWAQLKEGELALDDAQACVGRKPDWPKAHYREGVAWNLLKEYEKAAMSFAWALSLDPDNNEIEEAFW
ncbi:hypothetical protein OROHE_012846 [Orobanche hederae]